MKTLKRIKSLVVIRKRWYRGNGSGKSRLRLGGGCMCCLGFAMRACGATPGSITNLLMPDEYNRPSQFVRYARGLFISFKWVALASQINDNRVISEADRESQLKKLFKRHGIKLTFKD